MKNMLKRLWILIADVIAPKFGYRLILLEIAVGEEAMANRASKDLASELRTAEPYALEILENIKAFPVRNTEFGTALDVDTVLSSVRQHIEIMGEKDAARRCNYNFGAGGWWHPCWKSVDRMCDKHRDGLLHSMDIDWDISSGTRFPVDDGTAYLAMTGATIEHLKDEHVAHMFREAYRVLRPGGYFRVAAPDMTLFHRAWKLGDRSFFPESQRPSGRDASIHQLYVYWVASQLSQVDTEVPVAKLSDEEIVAFLSEGMEVGLEKICGRVDFELEQKTTVDHVNWWTPEKTITFLENAGFEEVYNSAHGQSAHPIFRDTHLFDTSHPSISLHVEARKKA